VFAPRHGDRHPARSVITVLTPPGRSPAPTAAMAFQRVRASLIETCMGTDPTTAKDVWGREDKVLRKASESAGQDTCTRNEASYGRRVDFSAIYNAKRSSRRPFERKVIQCAFHDHYDWTI